MKITVYLGTGGVGKTSVAAATALARARAGARCLVLTIDPAWRLRTALGLDDSRAEQKVALSGAASGELWAALLDVRTTLDDAVRLHGDPALVDRILSHPIYATIADSLAGMQELMAIERIDQLRRRGFDNIVVDTAPSRHAFEFLDKPTSFAELVGSSWVKLAGRTYKFFAGSRMGRLGRRTIEVYSRVEKILGADLVRQILDFYSIFVHVAEGYAHRARDTVRLLKDPQAAEFRIVTTPQKALRDAEFFSTALASRGFPLGAIYVNRVWSESTGALPNDPAAARLLEWYTVVSKAHADAVNQVAAAQADGGALYTLAELAREVDGLPGLEALASNGRLA